MYSVRYFEVSNVLRLLEAKLDRHGRRIEQYCNYLKLMSCPNNTLSEGTCCKAEITK